MEENIQQPIVEEKTTNISRKKILIIVLLLVLILTSIFFYIKYFKKVNINVENKSELSQLEKAQNSLDDLLKKRAEIEINRKNTIDSFNKEIIGINTKMTDLIRKIAKEKDIQALSLLQKEESDLKNQKISIEDNIKKENADYAVKVQMLTGEMTIASRNLSAIQEINIEIEKNDARLKSIIN